jgi:hypothetical protein
MPKRISKGAAHRNKRKVTVRFTFGNALEKRFYKYFAALPLLKENRY